jgi:hypothetical protein
VLQQIAYNALIPTCQDVPACQRYDKVSNERVSESLAKYMLLLLVTTLQVIPTDSDRRAL